MSYELTTVPDGARFLNYKGNQMSAAGQVLGPDAFGGMWQIQFVEYDKRQDTSRVGLMPYVEQQEQQ